MDEFRPWQLLTRSQIEMSPSFKEGMSFKTEKKLRETACKIINEAGGLAYLLGSALLVLRYCGRR